MVSCVTEAEKAKMRELKADGMSYRAIGREVGREGTTVMKVCSPEYAAKQKAFTKAWRESPKGKAYIKTYNQSPQGRVAQKAYSQSLNGKAYMKAYRESPQGKAYQKAYMNVYNQLPKVKAAQKAWRESLEGKAYMKAYGQSPKGKAVKKAYHQTIQGRLRRNLRTRLNTAIKRGFRAGSAVRDLGCTILQLKAYLEAQFRPGMTWDNWALEGWHIDHIKPLASFDLTDREQFKRACHFTNLQPLWAEENISKGAVIAQGGS